MGLPVKGRVGDVAASGQCPRLVIVMTILMLLVGLAAIVDEDNVDDSDSVGSSGGGIEDGSHTPPISGHNLRLQPLRLLPPPRNV